jgi:hypothetical protein
VKGSRLREDEGIQASCEEKIFSGEILNVDSAYGKLRKFSDDCKASENQFHYFCSAAENMTFQRAMIFEQKFQHVMVEKSCISYQKRIAPALFNVINFSSCHYS